jgi:hypothetical protein
MLTENYIEALLGDEEPGWTGLEIVGFWGDG